GYERGPQRNRAAQAPSPAPPSAISTSWPVAKPMPSAATEQSAAAMLKVSPYMVPSASPVLLIMVPLSHGASFLSAAPQVLPPSSLGLRKFAFLDIELIVLYSV